MKPGLFISTWPRNTRYSKFIWSSGCCYDWESRLSKLGSKARRMILALSAVIMYSRALVMWTLRLIWIL